MKHARRDDDVIEGQDPAFVVQSQDLNWAKDLTIKGLGDLRTAKNHLLSKGFFVTSSGGHTLRRAFWAILGDVEK